MSAVVLLIPVLAAFISVVVMVVALPYIGDLPGGAAIWPLIGSWGTLALLIGVVLLVAIGAGLYPALVVAGIRPALVRLRAREEPGRHAGQGIWGRQRGVV